MLRATGYNKSAVSAQTSPHPRYHFHGFAGDIISGDGKFFDRSPLGNHAVRGANLSEANMLANAGYVSTVDPVGGSADSVLRIPNLNFDYAGGEKLIMYWLGKATAEGASVRGLGDGYGTSYPGFATIFYSTGGLQVVLSDGTGQYFSANTVETPFDGNLHSISVVLDGEGRRIGIWVDEVIVAYLGGAYGTFSGGASVDTRNSNTFNIGGVHSAATIGASPLGIATQTRALHILRLGASDPLPSITTMTQVFTQLRADPSKPILGGAF